MFHREDDGPFLHPGMLAANRHNQFLVNLIGNTRANLVEGNERIGTALFQSEVMGVAQRTRRFFQRADQPFCCLLIREQVAESRFRRPNSFAQWCPPGDQSAAERAPYKNLS